MSTPKTDKAGIRQAIRALHAGGYKLLSVFDGEENVTVQTESEAMDAITDLDDAQLYVTSVNGNDTGWVRFVMGNDPDEVVCDYTTNLTPLDTLLDSWI